MVVLTGKNLPNWSRTDKDRFRRYVYRVLDPVASSPFVVVYLHTDLSDESKPSAQWLMNSFEVLPETYMHNMGAFFVVHPALTFRGMLMIVPFMLFSPFAKGHFVSIIQYVDRLEHLWEHLDESQLGLSRGESERVAEHDAGLESEPLGDHLGGTFRAPPPEQRNAYDAMMGVPAS